MILNVYTQTHYNLLYKQKTNTTTTNKESEASVNHSGGPKFREMHLKTPQANWEAKCTRQLNVYVACQHARNTMLHGTTHVFLMGNIGAYLHSLLLANKTLVT